MADETQDKESIASKLTGAKILSKLAMVVGGLWIGVLTILKGLGYINNLSVIEIIQTGVAIVGLWAPTYLSIILDKVKELRFGNGNMSLLNNFTQGSVPTSNRNTDDPNLPAIN